MAQYITDSGSLVWLTPAIHQAAPATPNANIQALQAQAANAQNAPANVGANGANAGQAAQPVANGDEENVPPPRRRRRDAANRLSVRELRRRARAIDPYPARDNEPKFRRVLGDMNGQQVRDLREHTLPELNGEGASNSRYLDLSEGRVQEPAALQDPYSYPSSWTTFSEDA